MSETSGVTCAACGRVGEHDPLVIHGDGVTDDTRAVQHAIYHGLPLPTNREWRVACACGWAEAAADECDARVRLARHKRTCGRAT